MLLLADSGRPLAQSGVPNPWISLNYVRDNADTILAATVQHVELTVVSVALGVLISVPLALVAHRFRRLQAPVVGFAGLLYTIPSLALFAVLAPVTGLTATTAVLGLTMYTLLVLTRNIAAGLAGVPDDVVEAARGMGIGAARLLLRIQLPLALPTIIAGLRIATVTTIAEVTVAVVVSNGGLGQLLFAGLNNNLYRAEIFTATALVLLLALVADLLLLGLERILTPWARA